MSSAYLPLPGVLRERVSQYLVRYRESATAELNNWFDRQLQCRTSAGNTFAEVLSHVWCGSEFVALNCIRQPELLKQLVDSGDLDRAYDEKELLLRCRQIVERAHENDSRETALQGRLRAFRRYEMTRIVWRDLSKTADLNETTRDMSRFADAVLIAARDLLHAWCCETWGVPTGGRCNTEQKLLILAMGKLGADELNVSSDIDLIFAYNEPGETQGGSRQLTNQEFFTRLAQKLIQTLDTQTADGRVFRVDMRLRPYGNSGALVAHVDALEDYYQTQGRDWERYAMIKCRVIDGAPDDVRKLDDMVRAFTYRRYTDFSVVQSLRDMKALISQEIKRRGLADNIKLGPGGIREIEFIAQAFQLIHGGRDMRFRDRRVHNIVHLLDEERLLPDSGGQQLWQAYVFLRNLEHVLQAWRDEQTQELPAAENDRLRVAVMLGYADWTTCAAALDKQRSVVSRLFGELAAPVAPAVNSADANAAIALLWRNGEEAELQRTLRAQGYDDGALAAKHLLDLRNSHAVLAMPPDTRTRLDLVVPVVMVSCASMANSAQTLVRVLTVIEAIARRSIYLVLLYENARALQQLVTLCSASPWISQSLSRHPALLDELLDTRTLYSPADRLQLRDELRQQLMRVADDDLEAQMETLRYFRLAHGLQIAACEVTEILPLMRTSDHLTSLAEVILEAVLELAWQQMGARYGNLDNQDGVPPTFLVVAYGKLGGIELAHGSDLDLVFLYDAAGGVVTSGERSIDAETFFIRVGQRIIHILDTVTSAGVLYEVDMRLRPSGNSGLLVSSINAFENYQRDSAWTWEHQALVRARAVAGDTELAGRFAEIRRETLMRKRNEQQLKDDIVQMRNKMLDNLALDQKSRQQGLFDLKQDPGGIVDIEFMVQFAVLAQAHDSPQLTRWTDNIRLLEMLVESGFFTDVEGRQLAEAYIAYRSAGHRLQLQGQPNVVPDEEFGLHRNAVLAAWQKLFGESALRSK